MFEFQPAQHVRDFNGDIFIGKMYPIRIKKCCEHNYLFQVTSPFDCEDPISTIQTYIPISKTLPEEFDAKVVEVKLVEAKNGGRTSHLKSSTWRGFFNDERKKTVMDFWAGGLETRMDYLGDPDQTDILVTFQIDGFGLLEIESRVWDFEAPEEWYSEIPKFQSMISARVESGFYATPEEAISYFETQASDDMFGTRYFPMVAMPKDHPKVNDLREIVSCAKSRSKPIVTDTHVVFGTRCKSYEFAGIIEDVYKLGGGVIRNNCWDWD